MSALNLDLTYFEHRKTKRLIGLLGRGSEVLPLKLWAYCGRAHPVDGSLADYSEQEIESLVGWWGQSGRFVAAMVTVGFIDSDDGSYRVHEWSDHQGHIAAFHIRAKKGAKARWNKIDDASSNASSNAKSETKQCPKPTKPTNQVNTRDPEDPAGFVHWWNTYPSGQRKTGRKDCLAKWKRLKLEADCVRVYEALRISMKSRDWTKNDGEFIPAPIRWLNKAPWESLEDLSETDPNDKFRVADDHPMFDEVTQRLNGTTNEGSNGNF